MSVASGLKKKYSPPQPIDPPLKMCSVCGVMVADQFLHTEWHYTLVVNRGASSR